MSAKLKKEAAADSQRPQTNESSAPSWKVKHGRVQGAMWQHPQENGKIRTTTSISRSYKNKKTDKWESVHFYGEDDLDHVSITATEAKAEIARLKVQ